mgnify:CR=1 FL=1
MIRFKRILISNLSLRMTTPKRKILMLQEMKNLMAQEKKEPMEAEKTMDRTKKRNLGQIDIKLIKF